MVILLYKGAMEQFYQKVINNTLNDIDKVHLRLILKKYSNRLEKYNETLDNLNSTDIHQIVKVKGRPKGTCKFTPEELRERARLRSKRYYDENIEKERERKRMDYHSKKKDNSDN
jgi:hypothetical protein